MDQSSSDSTSQLQGELAQLRRDLDRLSEQCDAQHIWITGIEKRQASLLAHLRVLREIAPLPLVIDVLLTSLFEDFSVHRG